MLHGVIVERDSESRELLARVLTGLDWRTDAFGALPDAEKHLAGAWAVFLGAEQVGGTDDVTLRRLREMAPGIVIVMILPTADDAQAGRLKSGGADVILSRPLEELAVIDAVARALINRRV